MKRRAGVLGVLLGLAIVLLLIIGTVTLLAVSGKITVSGITPKKTAGRVVEIGTFAASSLEVKGIVGNISIVSSNVSGILVRSNLPLRAGVENRTLVIQCPTERSLLGRRNVCNDYRNGTVIVEVPKGLGSISLQDVVGSVSIEATAGSVYISDVVGSTWGSGWGSYRVSDVVGKVRLNVMDGAFISDVVGDVTVRVPPGTRAVVNADDVVGKVINNANGQNETVEVIVNDIVGDVRVES
ncbi:hypothetical protein [Thermococcus sp.]